MNRMVRILIYLSIGVQASLNASQWRPGYKEAVQRYGMRVLNGWYGKVMERDGCMGDTTLTGRQIFLAEVNATEGSVLIPRRANDLDCYALTKYKKQIYSDFAKSAKKKRRIAVTVNGELQRLDPNTTIPLHVVAPYAKNGFEVTVFLSLQSRRPQLNARDWHSARFRTMPQYDDDQEIAVLDSVTRLFLEAGAACVRIHLYHLIRRPPQMPSRLSGANPGAAVVDRFQLVWPSYVLHMFVHSMVWRDVVRAEDMDQKQFDFIFKMRADSGWIADSPIVDRDIESDAVTVKACLEWDGINDKVALIPRRYADNWMDLLSSYYDYSLHGYKNSEQYQKQIAHRYHIPIRRYPHILPMIDFYWWLPNTQGSLGCFPWNYAGVTGTKCACVDHILCPKLRLNICAGKRPLGSGLNPHPPQRPE